MSFQQQEAQFWSLNIQSRTQSGLPNFKCQVLNQKHTCWLDRHRWSHFKLLSCLSKPLSTLYRFRRQTQCTCSANLSGLVCHLTLCQRCLEEKAAPSNGVQQSGGLPLRSVSGKTLHAYLSYRVSFNSVFNITLSEEKLCLCSLFCKSTMLGKV